jgi:hypothetical protein
MLHISVQPVNHAAIHQPLRNARSASSLLSVPSSINRISAAISFETVRLPRTSNVMLLRSRPKNSAASRCVVNPKRSNARHNCSPDGACLCWQCGAKNERRSVIDAIGNRLDDGWRVVATDINYENELWCDNCNARIEAAYVDFTGGGELP